MLVPPRRARTRAAVLLLAATVLLGVAAPVAAAPPEPPAPGFRLGAHVDRGAAASASARSTCTAGTAGGTTCSR
jgi:hypothetical protein